MTVYMGHIEGSRYCETGDKAIATALPLLKTIGTVELIEGGSELTRQLQKSGVDAMVFTQIGQCYGIEVKGATKTYSTIHIETVQDTRSNSPGWIHNIESDFLLWVYLDSLLGYMLRVKPLREWFGLNEWRYDPVEHRKPSGACSLGILVKWKMLYDELGANNFYKFNLKTNWDQGVEYLGLNN